MLQYCDLIAHTIKAAIGDANGGFLKAGRIESDLHPVEGYMQSTTKSIDIVDANGAKYRVTVEAIN